MGCVLLYWSVFGKNKKGLQKKDCLPIGGRKMQGKTYKRQNISNIFVHLGAMLMTCALLAMTAVRPVYAMGPGEGAVKSGDELRGVWISYLDWETLPSDQAGFQKAVDAMMERCVQLKMNAVFVHVRADSDAMYPSSYFPWSRFVTGTQGQNPGYDPLAYFVQSAHNHGLQFHAWINPFRVTGYHNIWDQVSDQNIVKKWLSDADTTNDRWVLKQNGAYYLNPSVPQVRELIVNGVREVVQNYDVDGIHFDDYFYPEVNDKDSKRWFDKPEYEASGSSLAIADWRRENVNQLIRSVYQTVKSVKPAVQFGISPAGNLEHLRSNEQYFTDIDIWMSQSGYVDYIMPQLYWGFEQKLKNGSLAPYAYTENLNSWIALKKKGNVRLYLGLAMYRTGTDSKDNNTVSEWLRSDDIIARQVQAGRTSGQVAGYCFYSYASFQESTSQKEVQNLMKILQ